MKCAMIVLSFLLDIADHHVPPDGFDDPLTPVLDEEESLLPVEEVEEEESESELESELTALGDEEVEVPFAPLTLFLQIARFETGLLDARRSSAARFP